MIFIRTKGDLTAELPPLNNPFLPVITASWLIGGRHAGFESIKEPRDLNIAIFPEMSNLWKNSFSLAIVFIELSAQNFRTFLLYLSICPFTHSLTIFILFHLIELNIFQFFNLSLYKIKERKISRNSKWSFNIYSWQSRFENNVVSDYKGC